MGTPAFHLRGCAVLSIGAVILQLPRRRTPNLTCGGGKTVEILKCGQCSLHERLHLHLPPPHLKPNMICSSLIITSIQHCQIREAKDGAEQTKPYKRILQLQSFIITYMKSAIEPAAAASQTLVPGSDVLLLGLGSHQAESD